MCTSYFQTDSRSSNILHCLAEISERHPQGACVGYKQVVELVDRSTLQALHKHENASGSNPLDYAAELCLPEIFSAFFHTDGVYRFVQEEAGLYNHVCYDVTRYESRESQVPHVLAYLSNVSEEDLNRFAESKLFASSSILTWCKSVHQGKLIWGNIICKLLTTALFYLNVSYFYSCGCSPLWLSCILLCDCISYIVTDITNIWLQRKMIAVIWRRLKKSKRPLVVTTYQKLNHLIYVLLCMIWNIITITGYTEEYQDICVICIILAPLFLFISYLTFFHMNQTLAHYIIIVQEVTFDCMIFMNIIIVVYVAFTASFYTASLPLPFNSDNSSNSNNNSSEHDHNNSPSNTSITKSIYFTFYDVVLVSSGIISPPDPYYTSSSHQLLLTLIYMGMALTTTLVIMNIIIGLFNDHTSRLSRHRKIITL